MKLLFSNLSEVSITLNNSELAVAYQKIYKNLQHITIPYRPWDSFIYYEQHSYEEVIDQLVSYAKECDIFVDKTKCSHQHYLNEIHTIFEKNYDGNPNWLKFHEHIHLCERYFLNRKKMTTITFRELSGPLEKDMKWNWINNTLTIKKGDVFSEWAELGKNPYLYWSNREPDNISRLCELSKPWLKLKPRICIAMADINLLDNVNVDDFEKWWATYHDAWCEHWKIPEWNLTQMLGVTVLGHVNDSDLIQSNLYNNIYPVRIKL